VLTGYKNSEFLAYMTDWYNAKKEWVRETKTQGFDHLRGICFNLLAGTAPDWIPHILTKEAMGGGFTGRCIFVVEDTKGRTIADPNKHNPSPALREYLIDDLRRIGDIKGEYTFDDVAHEKYGTWYVAEDEKIRDGTQRLTDPIFDGYTSRRASHLRKIAICLSASRSSDRIIREGDFKRALQVLLATEERMPRVFSGVGSARYAAETEAIMQYIEKEGIVHKSKLLRDFQRTVDHYSLESIINVLKGQRRVRVRLADKNHRETRYEWIDEESDKEEPESKQMGYEILGPSGDLITVE